MSAEARRTAGWFRWLLLAACWPALAVAYCDDAGSAEAAAAALPATTLTSDTTPPVPEVLSQLAREALARSMDVQSARHAGQAARFDLAQSRASRRPVLALGGSIGVAQNSVEDVSPSESRASSIGLTLSAPLYDGGRQNALDGYRERLVESGDLGLDGTRERVVRDTVLALLERQRYRQQVGIYEQYTAKMGCLVQSLQDIITLDRGRNSELLQARKGLRQAELSRDDARSALRQAEVRLRRLAGEAEAPWSEAIGAVLRQVPEPGALPDEIAASPEVRQLRTQVEALDRLSQANRAEAAPQLRWQLGNSRNHGSRLDSAGWSAGVSLSYALADGGVVDAATRATLERAEAARRQQQALIDERLRSALPLHDAALSAYSRATQVASVLQDSAQVRDATYEQWARLGRRSLFDLMSAEADHFQLRIAHVNALHDGYIAVTQLRSLGAGLLPWLLPEPGRSAP